MIAPDINALVFVYVTRFCVHDAIDPDVQIHAPAGNGELDEDRAVSAAGCGVRIGEGAVDPGFCSAVDREEEAAELPRGWATSQCH